MAQSAGFHEDTDLLSPATMDRHRAIVSIQEELEAVDWYDQRVDAARDPELKAILAHNRDEEKEHAAMTIEWLRRRDPALDLNLRTYLFTSLPVTEVEDAAMSANGDGGGTPVTPDAPPASPAAGGRARHRKPAGGGAVNHLLRELAPISTAAWKQIDDEASSRLRTYLAARRLVDFEGPRGWERSSLDVGGTDEVKKAPGPNVEAKIRRVVPLVELRVGFTLERSALQDADRVYPAIDLGPLAAAARQVTLAENGAVFHGYPAGQIRGITEESSHSLVPVKKEWGRYPAAVASAVARLRGSGVSGPYGLALGDEAWLGVSETIEPGGYPLSEHLARIVGGPIVWAPGAAGGILISQRGGDFVLSSGQDLSVGYLDHTRTQVTLYLEESFTFRVLEPDAAIALGS